MSKHKDLLVDNGSLLIPRNTTIWIPLGLPHASSAIYKDADQFIPERWLEPDAEYMPTHSEMFGSNLQYISRTASTDVVLFMNVTIHSSLSSLTNSCVRTHWVLSVHVSTWHVHLCCEIIMFHKVT